MTSASSASTSRRYGAISAIGHSRASSLARASAEKPYRARRELDADDRADPLKIVDDTFVPVVRDDMLARPGAGGVARGRAKLFRPENRDNNKVRHVTLLAGNRSPQSQRKGQ